MTGQSTPDTPRGSERKLSWRPITVAVSILVMIVSGGLFLWVQFYGTWQTLRVTPSFKAYADCDVGNKPALLSIESSGPHMHMGILIVTFGVDAASADCHKVRLVVPGLVFLSLGPTVFPSIVRSFKTSTDVKGTKFGPETENVPDDALMIRSGPNGSKILEIDLTKLNNPSGYFDFEWAGTRIKDFSSYLVIIPIDKGDTVLHDDRYHSPNSYEFNVLDDSLMDFEQFTPEPPQISYSGGYTRAVFPPVRHGEITFILKSRFWQSVGSTTQWISGIIFGIFATFLVAVIGFRV